MVDDIINTINVLIYKATEALEKGLSAARPEDLGFAARKGSSETADELRAHANLEIENGVHQLETLLEATVDKDFDKLEIVTLRSVLNVPEDVAGWIRLTHYEVRILIMEMVVFE